MIKANLGNAIGPQNWLPEKLGYKGLVTREPHSGFFAYAIIETNVAKTGNEWEVGDAGKGVQIVQAVLVQDIILEQQLDPGRSCSLDGAIPISDQPEIALICMYTNASVPLCELIRDSKRIIHGTIVVDHDFDIDKALCQSTFEARSQIACAVERWNADRD